MEARRPKKQSVRESKYKTYRERTHLQDYGGSKIIDHSAPGNAFVWINISRVVQLKADNCRHGQEGEDQTCTYSSSCLYISKRLPDNIAVAFRLLFWHDSCRYPSANEQNHEAQNTTNVRPFVSRLKWYLI